MSEEMSRPCPHHPVTVTQELVYQVMEKEEQVDLEVYRFQEETPRSKTKSIKYKQGLIKSSKVLKELSVFGILTSL